jgi:hypothetical protein
MLIKICLPCNAKMVDEMLIFIQLFLISKF